MIDYQHLPTSDYFRFASDSLPTRIRGGIFENRTLLANGYIIPEN